MTIKPFFGQLTLAEHSYRHFKETVHPDTKPEDVLDRKMWVHTAAQLTVDTLITVRTEDFSWRGEFLVTRLVKTGTGAIIPSLMMINYVDLTKCPRSSDGTEPAFSVEFKGAAKHVIVRNSDKTWIERDIPTKVEALARVAELLAA